MGLRFEWDPKKAISNRQKHSVSFEEASTVFEDVFSSTISDPLHSTDEERLVTIGQSAKGRLLVIVHTQRDTRVRLISAPLATNYERRLYEDTGSYGK